MCTDVDPGEPDEKGRKGIGESVDRLPVSLIRWQTGHLAGPARNALTEVQAFTYIVETSPSGVIRVGEGQVTFEHPTGESRHGSCDACGSVRRNVCSRVAHLLI